MKACTCGSSTEKPAKSMQKVVVVYILYVPKIFVKSVYVKYQIFGDIAKSVHTYIYIQAASIKCIYLSAAESRRYKQKVHTLYIHIHLYSKVYTLYIRINSINTSKSLHFCRQNIRNIRECRWQMESEHGRSFNKLEVQRRRYISI